MVARMSWRVQHCRRHDDHSEVEDGLEESDHSVHGVATRPHVTQTSHTTCPFSHHPCFAKAAVPVPVAGVQLLSLWSTSSPGGLHLQHSLSPCAPDPWAWACGAATRPCPQRPQGSFQCRRFLVGKRWRSPTPPPHKQSPVPPSTAR
jgi:hypothetical protein